MTKERIKSIAISIAALFVTVSVPVSFIFGSNIQSFLKKALKLHISAELAGGETIMSAYDPLGDDKGIGTFSYPYADVFSEGSLDLIKYTVHRPVNDYRSGHYWQCGIVLGNTSPDTGYPFAAVRVSVYIDTDGKQSGSTKGLPGNEDLVFDPEHPWDFAVVINGYSTACEIHYADGSPSDTASVLFIAKNRRIVIRFPLNAKPVERVLAGSDSWHYVFTQGYDRLSPDTILPVKEFASFRSGGGNSDAAPAIYDLITEKSISTEANPLLADFLIPLHCSPASAATGVDLELLKEQSDEWLSRTPPETVDNLADSGIDEGSFEHGLALFNAGKYDDAERILLKLEKSCECLAYMGAITAMKGGQTEDLFESVEFVNKGFMMMDESYELVSDDIEYITARLCRANTSIAVPEDVFHRCAQASVDFEEAAIKLQQLGSDKSEVSDILVKAAICADRAGDQGNSERLFVQAGSLGFSPYGKYEAAVRGIFL